MLLSLAMILTFMPAMAFAEGDEGGGEQATYEIYELWTGTFIKNQPSYIYDEEAFAEIYDEESEEYNSIPLKIKSATFTDSSYGPAFTKDEEGSWHTVPKETGEAEILVRFSNAKDESDTTIYEKTYDVTIVASNLDIGTWYDDNEGVFPGDDVALHLSVSIDDEPADLPQGARVEWLIDDNAIDKGCSITSPGDPTEATLHISDNYLDGASYGYIELTVSVYVGDELYARSHSSVDVNSVLSKFFVDELNTNIAVGESTTFTPVLKKKASKESEFEAVDAAEYDVYLYDSEGEQVYTNENAEITNNGDGSFTVKRIGDGYFDLHVSASYKVGDEEETITESTSFGFEQREYGVSLVADDDELYTLFTGATASYTAYLEDGSTLPEGCSLEFSVSKCVGTDINEDNEEIDLWEPMDNSGGNLFSVSGNKITLDGSEIWNKIKDSDYEKKIKVSVELARGESIMAYESRTLYVSDTILDYYYNFDLDDKVLIGDECYISSASEGRIYDAQDPEGRKFSFDITAVRSGDTSIASVEKNPEENGWIIYFKKAGSVNITCDIEDEFGNQTTLENTINVTTDRFSVHIDDFEYYILPGETVTLSAEGNHLNYEKGLLNDFQYKWVIAHGSNFATLKANGNKATITAKTDIDDDSDEDREVRGSVQLVKGGIVQAEEEFEIFVSDSYYKITPARGSLNSYLPVGSKISVTPKVIRRSFVNGKAKEETLNLKWGIGYDEADFEIKDASGNVIDPDEQYTGSFTATRKTADYTYFEIRYFLMNDEGDYEFYNEATFDFDDVYPLKPVTITGLKNKTYTGKAQTQSPVVERYGETLTLNQDYKISYKNNVNAGTATITITGINGYYGSVSSTFKINKAANPMAVKAKSATLKLKASKVKKKKQVIKAAKAYTFTKKAQGAVTYKLAKKDKKAKNKITVAKNGNITVKKGLKKGTYTISVTANAAGNNNYNKSSKTFKVKIKVK